MLSRNDARGFAERTRKNLEHIEKAYKAGQDVHVITQVVTSLLGLIVFPWEKYKGKKHFIDHVGARKLDELVEQGWPRWNVSKGTCDTLGQLVRHLRNAVAHGGMTFTSDSRYVNEVAIDFGDRNWHVSIEAETLRTFCMRFIDLLEDKIG